MYKAVRAGWRMAIGSIRIMLLLPVILFGLVVGFIPRSPNSRLFARTVRGWHGLICTIVGVRCRVTGADFCPGALVIANHISWIDISVLGSRLLVVFLANQAIRRWPVLGTVIHRGGTLFIEQGRGVAGALIEVTTALQNTQAVLIFPEGRTTDGITMRRFQPRLFQAAIESGAAIQPVAIRYEDPHARQLTHISYRDVDLLPSLWAIVSGEKVIAAVHLCPPIPATTDRNTLSQQTEAAIKNHLAARANTAPAS